MAKHVAIEVALNPLGTTAQYQLRVLANPRERGVKTIYLRPADDDDPEITLKLRHYFRRDSNNTFNIEIYPEPHGSCEIYQRTSTNQFSVYLANGLCVNLVVNAKIVQGSNVQKQLQPEPNPIAVPSFSSRQLHWDAMLSGVDGLDRVKYWIEERGEDPNVRDSLGVTALMVAAFFGNYEIAKYLIEKGAVPELLDDEGNTALSRAKQRNDVKLIELLERNCT